MRLLIAAAFLLLSLLACATTDGSNTCPLGTHWAPHTIGQFTYYTCEAD